MSNETNSNKLECRGGEAIQGQKALVEKEGRYKELEMVVFWIN
jgi:hypothetical protein